MNDVNVMGDAVQDYNISYFIGDLSEYLADDTINNELSTKSENNPENQPTLNIHVENSPVEEQNTSNVSYIAYKTINEQFENNVQVKNNPPSALGSMAFDGYKMIVGEDNYEPIEESTVANNVQAAAGRQLNVNTKHDPKDGIGSLEFPGFKMIAEKNKRPKEFSMLSHQMITPKDQQVKGDREPYQGDALAFEGYKKIKDPRG